MVVCDEGNLEIFKYFFSFNAVFKYLPGSELGSSHLLTKAGGSLISAWFLVIEDKLF